jgi:hypothetical protein
MTYIQPSHLQRPGDHKVGRGDLTGARVVTAKAAAEERASIIANSVRELQDPDTEIVLQPIAGRASAFALPRYVLEAIQRSAR